MKEDRFNRDFNKVENITAVCVYNTSWPRGEYPELQIGETYNVSHIGVFRSSTRIVLEGFGDKEYNSMCFELYENGVPLGRHYVKEFRFLAPYLREMIKESNPHAFTAHQKEDEIRAGLRSIAKEHDIKILMAVQTGSRALGLASPCSDWDVSFLFIHRPEWYSEEREDGCVIEQVLPGDIDICGWEIKDALHHMEEGNPTIFEWLRSYDKYVIDDAFWKAMQPVQEGCFSPVKAIAFYNQVYNKHNERFLSQEGNLKEFLYYLRGVLTCKWIERKGTMPTSFLGTLVDSTVDDSEIRAKINALIKIKRSGKNVDYVKVDAVLIEYVRTLAAHYDNMVISSSLETESQFSDKIDAIFQEMLQVFHDK